MKFLDSLNFWKTFWLSYIIIALVVLVVMDVVAVVRGGHDHVGDEFTLTHFLVKYVGISVIGAGIGYLIAHFLIVHANG